MMRVWDIDPGFLNNNSLLGEHREIHAIHTILTQEKKGYSRHPETLRWKNHLNALCARHDILVPEMALRGFRHQSPLPEPRLPLMWPEQQIDDPAGQFDILGTKYQNKNPGRILLPKDCQQLWAAHKYSMMARDPAAGKTIGRDVAMKRISFKKLSALLVKMLQTAPSPGRLINALNHMWGYLEKKRSKIIIDDLSSGQFIRLIQEHAQKQNIVYLIGSTALGELAFWCRITSDKVTA